MDDVFVEIQGLVKRFGPFTAVNELSFQVTRGEVLGFLGPNGAGKSTTMKMITGFLTPTEGRVSVCGNDIVEEPIAAQSLIGYLPEGAPAYGDMTPRQYLNFIAEVRGYRGEKAQRAVHQASSRAQLGGVMDQLIETLSKGFKRRVGLAQAILHDPPVLIMDEPTDGLDPNQKFAVRRLITGMARDKAIIISTHILEEVESVCSRALIIDRGRIVADGTPEQLAARSRFHNAVTMQVGAADAETARKGLASLPGAGDIHARRMPSGAMQFTLFPKDPEHLLIEDVSELVSRQDWDVAALYAEAGRLDEVFRTLTTPDAEEARKRPSAAGAAAGARSAPAPQSASGASASAAGPAAAPAPDREKGPETPPSAAPPAAQEPGSGPPAASRTPGTGAAKAVRKTAVKKGAARKTAARKTAGKKTAARKPAGKKAAAKKIAARPENASGIEADAGGAKPEAPAPEKKDSTEQTTG